MTGALGPPGRSQACRIRGGGSALAAGGRGSKRKRRCPSTMQPRPAFSNGFLGFPSLQSVGDVTFVLVPYGLQPTMYISYTCSQIHTLAGALWLHDMELGLQIPALFR